MGAEREPFEHISTHTPHARRDGRKQCVRFCSEAFQLTRLMRGVTALGIPDKYAMEFQLTRLMRGVTCARLDKLKTA